MFAWSILVHFDLLLYVCSGYFLYQLINRKNPPWGIDIGVFILFIPLIVLAHTSYNLEAFDFTNCDRNALEGPLWNYIYTVEVLILMTITFYSIIKIRSIEEIRHRREVTLSTIGIVAFLLFFSSGNIIGSMNADWEFGQWGLFGMPIFVGIITYQIVRYQTFNIKVLSTDALVLGQGILIAMLFIVPSVDDIKIIASITLCITVILGAFLSRTVRREIAQREKNEQLTKKLELINSRLKDLDQLKTEFVSVAAHQLRSPLTIIRNYASTILEGAFGTMDEAVKEAVGHIHEASKFMASSVEDYLSVSRIESGNMKYDFTDFSLEDEIDRIVIDFQPQVEKLGLIFDMRKNIQLSTKVHADLGKTRQILHNLSNNAVKYTPQGSITLYIHDDPIAKKVYVDIIDTGIGMSEETRAKLFGKFERAKDAHTINSQGSGLGLYIARTMTQAMGGDITAQSAGAGKGSMFRLTLPLAL
jgi:signal transduction histidine kinase